MLQPKRISFQCCYAPWRSGECQGMAHGGSGNAEQRITNLDTASGMTQPQGTKNNKAVSVVEWQGKT